MKTKITELLGIEYPIVQGAMASIAEHHLAAAVSKAGSLGVIAGGAAAVVKSVRRDPQGTCHYGQAARYEHHAALPECGRSGTAGYRREDEVLTHPAQAMRASISRTGRSAGVKVMPVVASVALAKRMERAGADAVIAEGMEGGGHIGELTTMPLVPQVVDALSIRSSPQAALQTAAASQLP